MSKIITTKQETRPNQISFFQIISSAFISFSLPHFQISLKFHSVTICPAFNWTFQIFNSHLITFLPFTTFFLFNHSFNLKSSYLLHISVSSCLPPPTFLWIQLTYCTAVSRKKLSFWLLISNTTILYYSSYCSFSC